MEIACPTCKTKFDAKGGKRYCKPECRPSSGKRKKKAAQYERRKETARAYEARKTKAGQDIGPIPPVVNLERKAAACGSLRVFCETYFKHRFYLGWSADHLAVIARFEDAILHGGLYALAMPRASGKTSVVEVACLWAKLIGAHKFVLLIGSSREHALEMLQSIKEEIAGNELLAEDFPEVCYPIACLEDRANRCKGQHTQGAKTKSVWSTDKIVLPTIDGSLASGATLRVTGITGRIRGAKKDTLRPSLVIPDDPQTDTSAASASQCDKRHRIINGAVLGLPAPGKKITVIMPCTVINRGDLADRMLDRDKSPLWTGHRFKMLYSFPANMEIWERYAVLRNDEFRNGGDGSQATAFYAENRNVMDAGAVVAWPERFEPGELSGIQHAMNLFLADKWAFWAERQNEPLTEDLGSGQLEKDLVAARVSGLDRYVVPLACSHVTCFVDVQQKLLYYLIGAWGDGFSGSIIDYGTHPDQGRRYFTKDDAQRTFAAESPNAGIEGQITAALGKLSEKLLGRVFPREDGQPLRIEKMLVDAGNWGDTVKAWARTTHHAAIVMPSHGHGVGAASKPWEEYDPTRCEKLGTHWMIPKIAAGKASLRHVSIDTNWWKTFVAQRLMQALGDKGALSIYGKAGQDHVMLADHFTSEYWIGTEGRGRKLHEWRTRPGQTENHFWDCLIGSAVAASMLGVALTGHEKPVSRRKVIDVRKEQAERGQMRTGQRYGT